MSKDLVRSVTLKTTQAMQKIVDNWVNDDNFTNTHQSKMLAASFQKILEGVNTDNRESATEGVLILDKLIRDVFNITKR